jgi:O-acetyl-ADP-ribose deacetylase
MDHIFITKQDICTIETDAIVNAANESLLGGGGVDDAIHRSCGKQLYDICKELPVKKLTLSTTKKYGRCDVGEVVVTESFNLDTCKYVFHTVAPRLTQRDGHLIPDHNTLGLCYESCLLKAFKMELRSITFCCLGTGIFGFPKQEAAEIALCVAEKYKNINVIFSCFTDEDYEIYTKLIKKELI